MEFTKGTDERGEFLSHIDMANNIVRHYYEELDRAILENMPDNVLNSLNEQISKEVQRRKCKPKK